MIKSTFPSKVIPLSSSVILVRPKTTQTQYKSAFDYQILLLKRNSKLSFGNFFAFPGGMLES